MQVFNVSKLPAREVDLTSIDHSRGLFLMSFGFDIRPLVRSIEAVGLINPPILKEDQGDLVIVAGHRRIQALRALEAEHTVCMIISENSRIRPLDCLLLNLWDNLAIRELNDVEKGMVLRRLGAWVPRHEIARHYMPLMGLPPHEGALSLFLEVETDYNETIKIFIAEGRLSWRAVKMLSTVDAAARLALLQVMSEVRLNANQQIQFMDFITDLSFIEEKTIPQVLREDLLKRVLSDSRMNLPQRAKALLQHLKGRRKPTLVAAEKRFKRSVSKLKLPDGVQITAPPYFEGSDYRLEALFKDGADLKAKLESLCHSEDLRRINNPWEEGRSCVPSA